MNSVKRLIEDEKIEIDFTTASALHRVAKYKVGM